MKIEPWVFIKGILMGAADIVPGVSGGTIAFITGIYERLLNALKLFVPTFLTFLKQRSLTDFLQRSDLVFLLTLFSGILLSVISLAKVISYLMESHPIPLWSAFFGLIVASVFVVARDIKQWTLPICLSLILGALIAWGVTQVSPTELPKTTLTIFISGLLAICAMVLPGISGSFILVMLGSYAWVLGAVKQFEFYTLGIFVLGCLCGLLSIANVLSWAFARYREFTLALLTGFMIGALGKVWPWREVLSYRENSSGTPVPLEEQAVLPVTYEVLSGQSADIALALVCALVAGVSVLALSYWAESAKK